MSNAPVQIFVAVYPNVDEARAVLKRLKAYRRERFIGLRNLILVHEAT